MTKAGLIERIARSRDVPPDLTKKDIALVLGIAFEELAGYFARAKVTRATSPRFTFPKFGTFTKKRRSARRGVNPRTLEPMEIEAFDTVDFKASRELREALNPGSTATAGAKKKASKTKAKRTRGAKSKSTRSAKASKKRRSTKRAAPAGVPAIGGRRLTPRDEEAELDAMIADDELFARKSGKPSKSASEDALPAGRLQRVEGGREPTTTRSRSRRNLP